jgi:WD40 repeat protein
MMPNLHLRENARVRSHPSHPLTTNHFTFKSVTSLLSLVPKRQISVLILLLSLIVAPVHGIAQVKQQEKREIAIKPTPTPSAGPMTPLASGDKPQLILQTGHTRSVNAVVFSPDNRWLASGGKDDVIKIWDPATGNVLRTLYGHTSNVNALAVSPDGTLLASGSGDINDARDLYSLIKGGVVGGAEDNTVRLWSIQTGRQLQVLRGHELPIGALAFSPDGHSLTSVGGDAVKVWDVSSGGELRSQQTQYGKSSLEKFGSFSIFGAGKGQKQEQQRLRNLKMSASKIALSANGQLAAVGQPDKAIKIYDAQSGRELRDLPFKASPESENSSLAFSADARLVAFSNSSQTVSVQEASTGRELYSVNTGFSKTPQRVQFSSDGRFLFTATDNSASAAMKLWDAASGQLIRELRPLAYALNVRVTNFNRDGTLIAAVGVGSKIIRIIEAATGLELRTLQTGTTDKVTQAEQDAFIKTIDSKTMATIKKRDITTPEQIVEAAEAMATISSEKLQAGGAVSFSPDGRFLISSHVFLKHLTQELWDTAAGALVRANDEASFRDRGKPFFSPDGRFRAAAFYSMKNLHEISAGSLFSPIPGAVNAYKDAYKQSIDLYEGPSDKHLRELDGGKAPQMGIVPAAGFSFDGKLVAMTGFEKKEHSVLVYEADTGRKLATFKINEDEQSGAVTTLCLTADEHFLAAGYDTKIDIFEAASGKTILSLPHAGRIVSLSFSPNGRFLIALGENNDKYIWSAISGEQLATLVNLGGARYAQGSDWLIVTPDGLFDGSPAAWKQILWQFGGNTFDVSPAETFFNEFYRPGLFAEVMAGKKPRAPRNLSQLDRRQPLISLSAQSAPTGAGNMAARNLTVKIEITEKPADKDHKAGSGAQDVRLFRNGSVVRVWHGDVLKGQDKVTLEATIPIVAGENQLNAYAFNHDNIKSSDAELTVTGADSLKRQGTVYVLAIGVNSYANEQYNLKYAVADAEDFALEVKRQQESLPRYSKVEVIRLVDAQATKTNITLKLADLAKQVQPEDAVIVFFAGHGTAQGNQFYLIPHDLGYDGPRDSLSEAGLQKILAQSVSDRELEKLFEPIDAGQFLMVIDACNSGQALEAEEKRRGPMNSKGLAQLAYEKGMYVLTAAQSYQAAQEAAKFGHGFLTYALVESGLKQGAADREPKNGSIDIREWLNFATDEVPRMQEQNSTDALRGTGRLVIFVGDGSPLKNVEGDQDVRDNVQRPRVFYRRELEANPLIVGVGSKQ